MCEWYIVYCIPTYLCTAWAQRPDSGHTVCVPNLLYTWGGGWGRRINVRNSDWPLPRTDQRRGIGAGRAVMEETVPGFAKLNYCFAGSRTRLVETGHFTKQRNKRKYSSCSAKQRNAFFEIYRETISSSKTLLTYSRCGVRLRVDWVNVEWNQNQSKVLFFGLYRHDTYKKQDPKLTLSVPFTRDVCHGWTYLTVCSYFRSLSTE